jgi:hypothetical protein
VKVICIATKIKESLKPREYLTEEYIKEIKEKAK